MFIRILPFPAMISLLVRIAIERVILRGVHPKPPPKMPQKRHL